MMKGTFRSSVHFCAWSIDGADSKGILCQKLNYDAHYVTLNERCVPFLPFCFLSVHILQLDYGINYSICDLEVCNV